MSERAAIDDDFPELGEAFEADAVGNSAVIQTYLVL